MRTVFLKIHSALQLGLLLGAAFITQATAGFTSIYAFGDGVCTTTAAPSPAYRYYGGRFCNGIVWIETLSQWQGLTYNSAKNNSFFSHDSSVLKTSALALSTPADAATSLFIVWCADADFVKYASDGTPWASGSLTTWNNKITQSINDHTTAINTLYNKGARLIIMPNAADVAAIPLYNNRSTTEKSFFRDRVISFNSQFAAAMKTLAASKGNLKIITPDVFTFFEQVQSNPALYGMVNPVPNNGTPTNAAVVAFPGTASATAGSPGTNYVFWDAWHPTAKFQMHLAAFIQQIISPVKVNSLSLSGGNVQMQVANIPLGRAGSILGSTNLQPPWAQDLAISEPFVAGGSTTKTYIFPASGSKRFYRAAFPVVWVWP